MRCSKAQRWISRRLDGELDAASEATLAAHLAGCGKCRAYADGLKALDLGVLEAPEPTADFAARVMQRLPASTPQRRLRLGNPALFRPIAAGLGLAASLIGFAIGSRFAEPSVTESQQSTETVEVTASNALDPLASDSIESFLVAMVPGKEE